MFICLLDSTCSWLPFTTKNKSLPLQGTTQSEDLGIQKPLQYLQPAVLPGCHGRLGYLLVAGRGTQDSPLVMCMGPWGMIQQ